MGWIRSGQNLIIPGWDSMAWILGLLISYWLSTGFDATQIDLPGLIRICLVAIAMQQIVGIGFRIYRGCYGVGSRDEALNLARITVPVGILAFALDLLVAEPWVPRSVPLTATLVALPIAAGSRLIVRSYRDHQVRPIGTSAQRMIIFGTGAALAGRSARIVYTGLREGEKLHEELFGDGEERDRRPLHPTISRVNFIAATHACVRNRVRHRAGQGPRRADSRTRADGALPLPAPRHLRSAHSPTEVGSSMTARADFIPRVARAAALKGPGETQFHRGESRTTWHTFQFPPLSCQEGGRPLNLHRRWSPPTLPPE